MQKIMVAVLLCVFSVLATKNANAQMLFQDDFSSGYLNNWTVISNRLWHDPSIPCFNFDRTANWNVLNQSLLIEITGSPCFTEIIPNITQIDTIDNYVFSFDIKMPESMNMDRNYLLKRQDKDNWYGMKIMNNMIFLEKVVSGVGYAVPHSYAYFDFKIDTTYRIENRVENGHIEISINGNKIIDCVDEAPFLVNAQVGLRASVGSIPRSITYFDNVSFYRLPSDIVLSVPYFSQRDDRWKDEEYDSATIWSSSGTTLSRWGCALTSATMILSYHDITKFADGTQINPKTLNFWLKSQKDGYIRGGLVNFLAITRLTKELSSIYGTKSLEYSTTKNEQEAIKQIDQSSPSIIQLSNHYVVLNGYFYSLLKHAILDPYDENKFELSQTDTVKSFRLFTPSNTDLSYVLFVYDNETKLDIENTTIETITEGPYEENGNEVQTTYIQKPTKNNYTVNIEHIGNTPTNIDIYVYDTNGSVSTATYTGLPGNSYDQFQINRQTLAIERTITLSTLLTDLQLYWKTDNISHAYVYRKLETLIYLFTQLHPSLESVRYIAYITTYLQNHTADLSSQAYNTLLQDLEVLSNHMR